MYKLNVDKYAIVHNKQKSKYGDLLVIKFLVLLY